MKDRLVRLEKALERRLDRLTQGRGTPEEPIEWIPPLLDEVEQRVVASGGRGRVFPYALIGLELRVAAASLDAARTAFGGGAFEERVRERLRQVRCEAPDTLRVRVRVRARTADDENPYALVFKRAPEEKRSEKPAADAGVPPVRITVLAGHSRRRVHELRLERINLGRLDSVEARGARAIRRNHVAFTDRDDPVNATVSRAHAHIEYFPGDGFRVFDDGSVHGTQVVREGRSIAVARGAARGVRLKDGDEIELGAARVTFATGAAEPA